MATYSAGKLNQLQQALPEGMLVDAAWLEARGYSSSLRSHYVRAGWLNQPAPRVYRRSHGPLQWEQVIISLQAALDSPLAVGGRTALEHQGYGHYLSATTNEVHLYGHHRPPSWLNALPLDVTFHYHNSQRLFPDEATTKPDLLPEGEGKEMRMPGGFMVQPGGAISWPLRLATPERAVLELLDELPDRESFHQVDMLMEGMANLSPRRLQLLLSTCRSVKVKRLFLFFADRHHHRWFDQLDLSAIALGSGKRMLAKGGVLNQRYQITVPEDLNGAA